MRIVDPAKTNVVLKSTLMDFFMMPGFMEAIKNNDHDQKVVQIKSGSVLSEGAQPCRSYSVISNEVVINNLERSKSTLSVFSGNQKQSEQIPEWRLKLQSIF